MSAAPDTSLGRRSIGEILLAHGYVTKEQVDEATAIQQESDRPLGQILVEAGSITRLELASALAEQWSDSGASLAQPLSPPLSGSTRLELSQPAVPGVIGPDREVLLSRLEDVEGELERLAAAQEQDQLSAVRATVDELAARLTSAEPAIEELVQRVRALADAGQDDGLDRIGAAVDQVHQRLSQVDQSLAATAQRSEDLARDVTATLASVQADLHTLSARIATLAGVEMVDDLRAVVNALVDHSARDADLPARIEALAATVAELGERRDLELAAQVEALADEVARLDARRDAALVAQVETLATLITELGDRVDADAAAQATVGDAEALERLQSQLAELAQRPVADPAVERRVDELAFSLEQLRATADTLAERHPGDPALDEKLWAIASRLEQLERADLQEELRARVLELAERPAADPALADRVAELEAKAAAGTADQVLEDLAAVDRSLGFRIDGIAARIDELATAVDQIASTGVSREAWEETVAALHTRFETTAAPASPDPKLEEQLAVLTERVDQLAGAFAGSATGGEAGDGTSAVLQTPAPALERDVEHVLMAIERLSVHLGAHERALTELMGARGVVAQLQELAARVGDLETYGTGGSGDGSAAGGGGDLEMRSELRSLMRRLEEAEIAQQNDRERVMEQLEKAAGAIDWRLQRLESSRGDEPDA